MQLIKNHIIHMEISNYSHKDSAETLINTSHLSD